MNKVNVELSANVKGFVDGMNQASNSSKAYETETRKISESTVNLNKELKAAKKEVQGLAAGYAKLDQEAKNSAFGKEMARQLEEAKKKAAEYIDLQGDLQQELKNLASDTRALNTLAEGMDVIGNATSATMGIIAQFTGKEEDARRAVVAFTTAQSALSTVTKLQNALQKQSNIMMGVAKVQALAAAAATKASTSATVGATVAQKAFNLVAKANPYVLLATAVIAATGAIVAFVKATNKAESAQERLAKEMHAASVQGRKDASDDIVKVDLLYNATQNLNLSLEDRKKAAQKLIDQYPAYFGNMTTEQIMLGESSKAYQQLKDDIIAVAQAKAYEQRITEKTNKLIDLEEKKKKQEADRDKAKANNAKNRNQGAFVAGNTGYGAALAGDMNNVQKAEDAILKTDKEIAETKAEIAEYSDKIAKNVAAQNRLEDKGDKGNKGGGGGGHTSHTSTTSNKADKEISSYQEAITEYDKLVQQKERLNKQLEEGRIDPAFADEFKKEISDVDEKIKKVSEEWHIKPKIEVEAPQSTDISKIQDVMDNALNPKKAKSSSYDFSALPEAYKQSADETIDAMKRIEKAQTDLNSIMNDSSSSDAQIAAAQEGLDMLNGQYETLTNMADAYQEMADETDKANKKAKKLEKTYNDIADACSSIGSAFSSLAALSEDDPALNIMGIVMEAVAKMFQGYATATAQAASMGPWAWVAFAAAGLAQTLAMVAQIKAAAQYAEGGVIGGNSYSGDRVLARVNSGEMILNSRQQRNLFNLLDTDAMPREGGVNVTVGGVVRGTDLLLVQKNTNKVRSKSGTEIYI